MYGDCSIFKEKIGKYSYTTVKYYENGRARRKRFPNSKEGEKEAKNFVKYVRAQKESGMLVPMSNMSVGQWIIEFMKVYLKPKYRPQTFERTKYTAKKLLPIYALPLDQITADQIQALYNSYADELKPASIYKIHKLLQAAFKKALITRRILRNPMDAVEPPKVTQEEITIFSFTELLRLFRTLRKKEWRYYSTFFHLLLVTGMRIGELIALRFEDIDFEKREIHICQTKVGRTGNEFNEPKTKAGNRYIPILYDKTLDRIRKLRQKGNLTRLTGYLFQTRSGNALNYNNIRRDWVEICEEAGIELKHIHAFRHTFATTALAKGIPVLEVSRILGHSNATTTLNMYGHAMPGYNKRLIEQFQKKKKEKQKPVPAEIKIAK
ncbi:MAG: site-specific integrase [Acidaminococcaceae bacterium]|nr:site-specific integrase [Acidaminococcaceae bacterium]